MTSAVLDASAVIAVLAREPGADVVRGRLSDSFLSTINYSEVLKKTLERGGLTGSVEMFIRSTPIRIVPFDEEQASSSAALYPHTKHLGLSFADRACLALGLRHKADVLTTEGRMSELDFAYRVVLIRGRR